MSKEYDAAYALREECQRDLVVLENALEGTSDLQANIRKSIANMKRRIKFAESVMEKEMAG